MEVVGFRGAQRIELLELLELVLTVPRSATAATARIAEKRLAKVAARGNHTCTA
jgi:hypothetical protein